MADSGTRKIERDTVHHLARIATALETISDTLAKMHAADPMAMIQQAVAAEAGRDAEQVDPNYVKPPEWMTR